MVIHVNRTQDYVAMSKRHLTDPNLSIRAKGLLSMLLLYSHDWTFSEIATMCRDEKAIAPGLAELEKSGYLARRCTCRGETCYAVYEQPVIGMGLK